jgi:Fe-Mn family superoxide dismutase
VLFRVILSDFSKIGRAAGGYYYKLANGVAFAPHHTDRFFLRQAKRSGRLFNTIINLWSTRNMAFELPKLPYPEDGLKPFLSREALMFHHGKHHKAYVDKLNELIDGTKLAKASLEEIIKSADGAVFNNAGQHFNHSFYWQCMEPKGGGEPSGKLADAIKKSLGGFDKFRKEFGEAAGGLFGSGWAWLSQKGDGSLLIETTGNADLPLRHRHHPLLTCDVWEHAYYIDYRNKRPEYVQKFFDVINWEFVASNMK